MYKLNGEPNLSPHFERVVCMVCFASILVAGQVFAVESHEDSYFHMLG